MILETYYATPIGNGAYVKETRFEVFDTRHELDQALFLYKMSENLGYRVYDCTIEQYNQPNRDVWLQDNWYDKEAIRAK